MGTDFAEDITRRCRWALAHNGGRPSPAWSAGEQLAVALVLADQEYLDAEGYTRKQAVERLSGDLAGADPEAWLWGVRGAVRADLAAFIGLHGEPAADD
jgi:hypothetical protein